MIIRAAQAEDAAAIAALQNSVIDTTTITFTTDRKTEDGVRGDIAARGPGFQVAETGGSVAGYATFFPFRSGPGYARTREHSIALIPSARGIGAGRALMLALEEVARAQGTRSLIAGISGENPSAVAFHAALGYVEVGRLSDVGFKFDRWIDLVLMQKKL